MSDDENVISLRPRNTARPGLPPLPPRPPGPPPPAPTAPPPGTTPASGAVPVPDSNTRRSAADSLATVTAPGLPALRRSNTTPAAAFRSDGLDDVDQGEGGEEIGMGTLGLAAVLAVALAALRGTAGMLTDWRQRRLEKAAAAAPLRAAQLKLKEAQARAGAAGTGGGRVPSSSDYGRRSLSGGSGSGGGGKHSGSSVFGPGRSGTGGGKAGRGPAGSGGSGTSSGSHSGGAGTGPGRHGRGGSGKALSGTTGDGKAGGRGSGGSGGSSGGPGSGSSGGSGSKKKPGLFGQLALDRSKRRTAREAADVQHAARQHKADLAARKRAEKDGSTGTSGDTGGGDKVSLQKNRKGGKDKAGGAGSASPGTDRVTLGQSLADEIRRRAADRLRARRENPEPFLRRMARGDQAADDAAATDTPAPEPGTTTPGPGTPPEGGPDTHGTDWEPDWEFWAPPGGNTRRNPWDSLFEATWDAEVIWTVERIDQPGDAERHWTPEPATAIGRAPAALAAVPAPATPAGTTNFTKEPHMSAHVPIPVPHQVVGVASEHLTEVTLDDVLEGLSASKDNCLATYDECAVLATKARVLRDQFVELARELALRHNVVGRLSSNAMRRLAESMDLLARKAEEMRTESMTASEFVESAHDAMHDAYKPVQQAAADAGLAMPSARIHNED